MGGHGLRLKVLMIDRCRYKPSQLYTLPADVFDHDFQGEVDCFLGECILHGPLFAISR